MWLPHPLLCETENHTAINLERKMAGLWPGWQLFVFCKCSCAVLLPYNLKAPLWTHLGARLKAKSRQCGRESANSVQSLFQSLPFGLPIWERSFRVEVIIVALAVKADFFSVGTAVTWGLYIIGYLEASQPLFHSSWDNQQISADNSKHLLERYVTPTESHC